MGGKCRRGGGERGGWRRARAGGAGVSGGEVCMRGGQLGRWGVD